MNDLGMVELFTIGFLLTSIGGLGGELLDRFAGRPLEAYCRLKKNRERFGAVLDHQDAAIRGSEYLRMIGTVLFLIFGTAALFVGDSDPAPRRLLSWAVIAGILMMMMHVWLPAAVTRFASTQVLYHTWPFWRSLSTFMRPLAAPGELVELITRRLTGAKESEDEDEEQLEDEIRTIVTAGTREGYFGPGVREMIQGVMTLHEDTVGHIMTPRGDVDAIDVSGSLGRNPGDGRRSWANAVPGLRGDVGSMWSACCTSKTCCRYWPSIELAEKTIAEIMRRPWTVPMDRSVELLLREFLHSRIAHGDRAG